MNAGPAGGAPPRRSAAEALLGVAATLVVALTLEFLGWRIVHPGLSPAQAWGLPLLLGGLHTAAGAAATGLVFVAIGLVFRAGRRGGRLSLVRLWCGGAAVFLLLMGGLVAWAP